MPIDQHDNLADAREFCEGAFKPFGVDIEPYVKIIAELLDSRTCAKAEAEVEVREIPQKLTGELACILEGCDPPEHQTDEAVERLIFDYQPMWDRLRAALANLPAKTDDDWLAKMHGYAHLSALDDALGRFINCRDSRPLYYAMNPNDPLTVGDLRKWRAALPAKTEREIKWTEWDGAINTDQPIFDAIAAATQIDTEPDGVPRIVMSARKFIDTFNNHRDRALCTSVPAKTDAADERGERLRQVLGAFYKTVDVMKSARNKPDHMMCVWADDMKAIEDVMFFLENLRDALPAKTERAALEHARARFLCLAEDFEKAGDTVQWAMCSVDAERMGRALVPPLTGIKS